jgi:alpha-beta hydrolase superfamily lysophospholipase
LIPYEDGYLSAYRFTPKTPKGVVVICNGFDGYIEEITRILMIFRDAGYDTIVFDDPGQGTILEEYHMPMTHEWAKPVHPFQLHFAFYLNSFANTSSSA